MVLICLNCKRNDRIYAELLEKETVIEMRRNLYYFNPETQLPKYDTLVDSEHVRFLTEDTEHHPCDDSFPKLEISAYHCSNCSWDNAVIADVTIEEFNNLINPDTELVSMNNALQQINKKDELIYKKTGLEFIPAQFPVNITSFTDEPDEEPEDMGQYFEP